MRGADALTEALLREGVDTVFGIPGGASLPLYDALLDSPIRHVLTRHEAGAGHAAQGYARATGRVGVAFATSGPGATNLLTPICDAYMDSTPTVFVTGQVPTRMRGTNAFQEADVIGMTAPMVKHSFAVESADELAQTIHDAFHLARTGRPGPVLVDVPSDVARAPARERAPHPPCTPGHRPRLKPNGKQVRLAAQAIAAARRPVLYAGGGIVHAEAADELIALARLAELPVTTTLMGLGAFPASDRRFLGMLGMHGTRVANWAIDEADLIVAVGARFDDRVTGDLAQWAPRATIVHLDVDPSEIGKLRAAHVPIVADARLGLAAIRAAYAALEVAPDAAARAAWWARIAGWKAAHPDDATAPAWSEDGQSAGADCLTSSADAGLGAEPGRSAGGHAIDPYRVLDALQAATGGEAIVSTDVGQHQMWAANRLRFERPRRWLTSGGHGTMGFGLPAALGAQAALPDATVVCVTGEGSLLMNVQELATAAQESLPVKVVVLNNRCLGMVRQQQDMFWDGRRAAVDLGASPDWELLARAFGVAGRTVRDADEVADALAETIAEPGPALLDVKIVADADALPMFRPGGAARDMVG